MTRATITRKLRIYDPSALPAWLQGKAINEWVEVPSSRIDQAVAWSNYSAVKGVMGKPGLFADSGAAIKASGSELFIAGGGHTDYAGNEIFSLRLADDAPVWVRRTDPTPNAQIPWGVSQDAPSAYYDDGRPAARHTYWNLQFCDERDLAVFFGCYGTFSANANSFAAVDAFDANANEYIPGFATPSATGTWGSGVVTAGGGDVYMFNQNGLIRRWNQASNTFADVATRGPYNPETGFAYDSKRNRILRMPRFGSGAVAAAVYDLNNNAAATTVTMNGYSTGVSGGKGAVIYCPAADAYYAMNWGEATLWRIDPVTFAAAAVTTTGSAPPMNYDPGGDGFGRFYGRFNYAPELRAIVFALRPSHPVRVMRTA